jgi:hypothetical protein
MIAAEDNELTPCCSDKSKGALAASHHHSKKDPIVIKKEARMGTPVSLFLQNKV